MRLSLVCRVVPTTVTVLSVLFVPAPTFAAGATGGRYAAPNHKISHSSSTNWSGYAVSGFGPYTTVSSSWTQPAVDCARTPTGWSSFWVGLDGDTTNTVEQTGTEADCSSGTAVYYAWYEMYPKYPVNYSNPVSPGDSFSASVNYSGRGNFQLTLRDTTKGWSQTTTQRLKSAKLGSAEVIAEAPSSSGGVLPLADFGTLGFSGATVNGSLLTSSTPGIDPITMVSGGTVKAAPSAISSGGFSDTWHSQ
jgi:Peptidase A4 family